MGLVVDCPACEGKAWISGEFVRAGEPQAAEDEIVQEIVKIPTALDCAACGLSLAGHGRLHAIGHGGLFSAELHEDPASFYNIEFEITEADIARYFEDEYMNE
jgi:hypothetical protein